jgi:hypothetical protein
VTGSTRVAAWSRDQPAYYPADQTEPDMNPDVTPRRPTVRTPDERRRQLRAVESMLDAERPVAEIVQRHMRDHGVSRRQAFRDLKAVRRKVLKRVLTQAGGRSMAVARAAHRLDQLYGPAMQANDLEAALKAEIARCRILGLYPEQVAFVPVPGPVRPDLHRPDPDGTGADDGA